MSPDDTIDLRRLGENLAREREKAGLTRKQIAEFLNLAEEEVATHECGEGLSLGILARLADLYGHTLEYMLGEKNEEPMITQKWLSDQSTKAELEFIAWLNGFILHMLELEEIMGA
jgi:transcriptional regulator with XRE-family HTH domain